jgi:hypothetical protein
MRHRLLRGCHPRPKGVLIFPWTSIADGFRVAVLPCVARSLFFLYYDWLWPIQQLPLQKNNKTNPFMETFKAIDFETSLTLTFRFWLKHLINMGCKSLNMKSIAHSGYFVKPGFIMSIIYIPLNNHKAKSDPRTCVRLFLLHITKKVVCISVCILLIFNQ